MKHTKLNSSNLASYGYDKNSMVLEINFVNGNKYAYSGVTEDYLKEFLAADSKGKFFHERIKTAFPCTKCDEVEKVVEDI